MEGGMALSRPLLPLSHCPALPASSEALRAPEGHPRDRPEEDFRRDEGERDAVEDLVEAEDVDLSER
jgi:hypothetical protein